MSFPADVFYPAQAELLPEGTLLYARDAWWLRCSLVGTAENVVPKVLALTGDRTGVMTMLANSEVLAVNSKYGWEIRIPHPLDLDSESKVIGSISVGEGSLIGIWGHIYGDTDALYCIAPDGTAVANDLIPWSAKVRYPVYHVWLQERRTGKLIGDAPLFSKE
ncbi:MULTISPECIES: hypothetical protein [Xanthomonas]|uniref:hypothetical protein n=1 Tax=Xanthomonas TaxID=338 RepID=UPI000A67D90D|nr:MULTISPECIES: hypothetical protein [Xanthomonas]MCC5045811.1 hypothetical protein [Xanthomonas campestris]MDV2451802.1 hypothetical protein [Xanthomonas hortorum NBC5720]